jgi:hypothetical protein
MHLRVLLKPFLSNACTSTGGSRGPGVRLQIMRNWPFYQLVNFSRPKNPLFFATLSGNAVPGPVHSADMPPAGSSGRFPPRLAPIQEILGHRTIHCLGVDAPTTPFQPFLGLRSNTQSPGLNQAPHQQQSSSVSTTVPGRVQDSHEAQVMQLALSQGKPTEEALNDLTSAFRCCTSAIAARILAAAAKAKFERTSAIITNQDGVCRSTKTTSPPHSAALDLLLAIGLEQAAREPPRAPFHPGHTAHPHETTQTLHSLSQLLSACSHTVGAHLLILNHTGNEASHSDLAHQALATAAHLLPATIPRVRLRSLRNLLDTSVLNTVIEDLLTVAESAALMSTANIFQARLPRSLECHPAFLGESPTLNTMAGLLEAQELAPVVKHVGQSVLRLLVAPALERVWTGGVAQAEVRWYVASLARAVTAFSQLPLCERTHGYRSLVIYRGRFSRAAYVTRSLIHGYVIGTRVQIPFDG